MAGISGKARRMAEDKPDVIHRPSQCREVRDVLGDKHALVEHGDGQQLPVAEPAEFPELLDGDGVDLSVAEPLGRRRWVHLIEKEPHAGEKSGSEECPALIPSGQLPVRGRGVGCDALVDLNLVRGPVAGDSLDLPG